ncbi:MAG: tetratricopeptide repeat protein [Candidatus Gastranaerophilales bacterium]|nr:tetratricopeptide repeat protein [Candidatus Gastranaerophilales bacterium]
MFSLRVQPQTSPNDKYVGIYPAKPRVTSARNSGVPSFTPNFGRTASDSFTMSQGYVNRKLSEKYKGIADDYARKEQNNIAIDYYRRAITTKPDYAQSYYNLARVYERRGDIDQAIEIYEELLSEKPDEPEAQTLIGKCYKDKGDYTTAKTIFEKAVQIDPKYDFASRSLKEIDNLILAQTDPMKAEAQKQEAAQRNMGEALGMVNQYVSPKTREILNNLTIEFADTDSLSGYQNIAQYENHNKRIVITKDYLWAAPEITAAYIVHEAVHARDQDGLSSIKEEQDAYELSVRFWLEHNNGVKDPELDYASGLYKDSPELLKSKVAETYRSRDKSMPESSPNHIATSKNNIFTKISLALVSTRDKCFSRKIPIS